MNAAEFTGLYVTIRNILATRHQVCNYLFLDSAQSPRPRLHNARPISGWFQTDSCVLSVVFRTWNPSLSPFSEVVFAWSSAHRAAKALLTRVIEEIESHRGTRTKIVSPLVDFIRAPSIVSTTSRSCIADKVLLPRTGLFGTVLLIVPLKNKGPLSRMPVPTAC